MNKAWTIKLFLWIFTMFILDLKLVANDFSTIVFKDSVRNYFVSNKYISVFEDSSNQISNPAKLFNYKFEKLSSVFFTTLKPLATYWVNVSIIDSSRFNNHWYFVSYNNSADSMDLFVMMDDSLLFKKEYNFRTTTIFEKDLAHKNLTMDFSIPKNKRIEVFIKIKNSKPFQYGFAFRDTKEYFSTSVREYFWMGMFYGAILMITLYQLTFFFSLKDYAYVFYVIYILIQGIYLCFRDASALVFLFPNSPYLLESAYTYVMCGLSISMLFYARFFLQLASYKWFDRVILTYSIIRVGLLLTLKDYPIGLMWFDLTAIGISFLFSIVSLIQHQRTSWLFCISFGVIIIGHFVNVSWHANIIPCTDDVFYSLYYAVLIESLLLAVANAYRISRLREFALMKNVLEKKVGQNLETIQAQEEKIKEKSDELDVFLYRASHDIKGPLKSIEGLSKVGLLDKENKDQYFHQIAKTSAALQKILNALLHIAKQNRSEFLMEPILVKALIQECLSNQMAEYPGLNEMKFEINVDENATLKAEKFLLLSIIQNLIENAIKYRDFNKNQHYLNISFSEDSNGKTFTFKDNGVGVSEESLKKLFQMFFRANNQDREGAGLGLYIVKQNVEKLGGKISVESIEGEFTMIRLEFVKNIIA